jgi:hypothetical protein
LAAEGSRRFLFWELPSEVGLVLLPLIEADKKLHQVSVASSGAESDFHGVENVGPDSVFATDRQWDAAFVFTHRPIDRVMMLTRLSAARLS